MESEGRRISKKKKNSVREEGTVLTLKECIGQTEP